MGRGIARLENQYVNRRGQCVTGRSVAKKTAERLRKDTVAVSPLVGGDGIIETFALPLDHHEFELLQTSAGVIRQTLEELETKL